MIPLSTSYKLALTMNNMGATVMEHKTLGANDSSHVMVTDLLQSALRALNHSHPQTFDEVAVSQQILALSSLPISNFFGQDTESLSEDSQQPHRHSTFFLIRRPLKLSWVRPLNADGSARKLASAVVLFNLALLHQLVDDNEKDTTAYAEQAAHLYHQCAATMVDIPDCDTTFFLAVACLNNVGVLCHEAGDVTGAQSTMVQLSGLLATEDEFGLEESVSRGVQSNIITSCAWQEGGELLTPFAEAA